MLEKMRNLANNFIMKLLLGLIVVSFVAFGIGDMVKTKVSTDLVLIDGHESIAINDFQNAKQNHLNYLKKNGAELTKDELEILNADQDILYDLINKKLLNIAIKDLGIEVSDKLVASEIVKQKAFLNEDGSFSDEKFRRLLSNYVAQYEEQVRSEIANKIGFHALFSRPIALNHLSNLYYLKQYQKRLINIYSLNVKDVIVNTNPTEQEIENYYNTNSSEFTSPETRLVGILQIKIENEEKLQEVIDDIENDLSSNIEFEEIAAKHHLPLIKEEHLSGPAFELSENEVSELSILPNNQGYYLLKLYQIKKPILAKLEEAKPKIVEALKEEATYKEAARQIEEAEKDLLAKQPINNPLIKKEEKLISHFDQNDLFASVLMNEEVSGINYQDGAFKFGIVAEIMPPKHNQDDLRLVSEIMAEDSIKDLEELYIRHLHHKYKVKIMKPAKGIEE